MNQRRHISLFVLRSIGLLLVCTYLSLLSCRKSADPGAAPPSSGNPATVDPGRAASASVADISSGIDLSKQAGTHYQVTYANDVIRVSAATVRHDLIGVNRDHDIYIFSDSPELRSKLTPGSVVLFEGASFKKIQAIAIDDSRLIVGVEEAPLNRLFKDADIRWHAPINFLDIHNRQVQALSGSRNAAPRPLLPWLAPAPVHAAEAEAKEEEEEGWHVKYDTDFSPDQVNFQVDLSRKGELDAVITGNGYIKNFESSLALTVNNSQVSQFDFSNKDMNGIVDFNWTIGVSGKPPELGEERLKLSPMMSVPLFLGGLPFTLEVGEALLFHPAFSAKEEIAKGAFHVDYNGVTGLSVTSGSGSEPSEQSTSNASSDSSIQNSTAFSPLAAFGVVVAMAMPRFELKTGAEEFLPPIPESLADRAAELLAKTTIGHFLHEAREALKTEGAGYFQVVFSTTASHSGMLSLVPCQRFMLHVNGEVGANLYLLGMRNELFKPITIFHKDIDQSTPNAKICTG
jgi:hypothetical protein